MMINLLILTSHTQSHPLPPSLSPQLTEVFGDQTITNIRPGVVRNMNISRSEEGWEVVEGGWCQAL